MTARKVEESAQNVPVSITAYSGADLSKNEVVKITDLHVPGLYITTDTQFGNPTFAIRGAKSGNGTSDTVTTYVGDVPVVDTTAIAHMTYDMRSISVLKGPQGTLFGSNSTGGAIIFLPNAPSTEFEGYLDAGYGNYNRATVEGMINVPINDMLQIRIAGNAVDQDKGFQINHTPTGNEQLDTEKDGSVRVSIRFTPSDAWQNDLMLEGFDENDRPHEEVLGAHLPSFTAFGFFPVSFSAGTYICCGDRRNLIIGGNPEGEFRKNTDWDANYTTTYKTQGGLVFKSVLAYQSDHDQLGTDNDVSAFPVVGGYDEPWKRQWSWEPSIDWNALDGHLRNKSGLFLYDLKWTQGNDYGLLGLPFNPPLAPAEEAYIELPYTSHSWYDRRFDGEAIYSQFSYDLTDEVTATVGARYSRDRGSYSGTDVKTLGPAGVGFMVPVGDFATGGGACINPTAGYESFDPATCTVGEHYKSDAPSFTFTLDDKVGPNSMVYVTSRGGYLIGGFNNQIPAAAVPLGLLPTFAPEKDLDFEAGIKSEWKLWNRPIRTNLDGFYARYRDQQRFQNGDVAGISLIGTISAGSSEVYGFDFEIAYQPTDNLEVSGNWTHIATDYLNFKSFVSGSVGLNGLTALPYTINLTGSPLAQAPSDVVNLAATYKWPVLSGISSSFNYYWTTKTTSQDTPTVGCVAVSASGTCTSTPPALDFQSLDKIPSYGLLGFTSEWKRIMDSPIDAKIWVKNLTDKQYWTAVSNQMLVFGYASRIYGDPRTFGLNVRYNF